MAKEAERLLEDTRWLPEPLRLSELPSLSDITDGSPGSLPEFLSGEVDDDRPHLDAAE
jgi:ParB family transcriptional regulator, chromosome partitioning protein